MPAMSTPGTSATVIATCPDVGVRLARPRPSTIVSASCTRRVCSRWYTPGVSSRWRPLASSRLIVRAESDGFATKKSSTAMERPGVGPESHVVPRLSVAAAGTNTW
jgi:hypothetical protein